MNAKLQNYICKNRIISILARKLNFRKVLNVCFVLAVLVAGYFIVRNFNRENIISIKERLNYFYFVEVFCGILIIVLLRVTRWLVLLRPIKRGISFSNILEIYSGAQILNYAAPGKWAVPARAFFLKKLESVAITRSIPSLLSELFLDISGMFGLLSIMAVSGGYFSQIAGLLKNKLLSGVFGFFILFALGGIVFYFLKGKNRFLDNLLSAVQASFKQPRYFLGAFALTGLILPLSFLCDMLILRGLGLIAPYRFVVMSFSFSAIMGFLSPLPGGIGVNEISNAYLFRIFYEAGELALIATFLRRVLDYLMLIIIFVAVKVIHRKKTSTVRLSTEATMNPSSEKLC